MAKMQKERNRKGPQSIDTWSLGLYLRKVQVPSFDIVRACLWFRSPCLFGYEPCQVQVAYTSSFAPRDEQVSHIMSKINMLLCISWPSKTMLKMAALVSSLKSLVKQLWAEA